MSDETQAAQLWAEAADRIAVVDAMTIALGWVPISAESHTKLIVSHTKLIVLAVRPRP